MCVCVCVCVMSFFLFLFSVFSFSFRIFQSTLDLFLTFHTPRSSSDSLITSYCYFILPTLPGSHLTLSTLHKRTKVSEFFAQYLFWISHSVLFSMLLILVLTIFSVATHFSSCFTSKPVHALTLYLMAYLCHSSFISLIICSKTLLCTSSHFTLCSCVSLVQVNIANFQTVTSI